MSIRRWRHRIDLGDVIESPRGEFVLHSDYEAVIARQATAAKAGMNAAKAISSRQLQAAARLRAESAPGALESERAANAILTAENDALRDLLTQIALKVNCLPSSFPDGNEHVLRAIVDLEEIAKAASQVSVDWDADDDEVIFSLDILKEALRPWRKSRKARADWERQQATSTGSQP